MANLFSSFRAGFPQACRPFLHLEDGAVLSYGELLAETARIAHLLTTLGVRPGDRVATQVAKSPRALLLYLATVRAGAVHLPLNPAYTLPEVRYFLEDAAPTCLVCDAALREPMGSLAEACGVPVVLGLDARGEGELAERLAGLPEQFDDVPRSPEDLAAILYTSGTTGRSKGAMLSIGNLLANCRTLRDLWRFTANDRLLHALPIFHTHGLFVATNVTLAAGSSMDFLSRFEVPELLRRMPAATVLMGVPTFYTRLLADPGFTRECCAGMRLFISGSAPLSAETHRQFAARTGHSILERYGMTETNMNTSNPCEGERVPGSVGLPLPGTELRIADPLTGRDLAAEQPGTIGVIEVRGPHVFRGYWRNPLRTAEDFRADGYFITGDLGYRDARGYVFISGRAKDLVISGGFNVYPAELENLLDSIPGVAESAVIGVPHPDLGEAVVAVVQARDPALDEGTVLAGLSGQLARYKQPRRVVFVAELPRNTMGKVQKNRLREQFAELFPAS
ncbi:MAG: malonate--CoA ligase [Gammaproteobacteria bacterium]